MTKEIWKDVVGFEGLYQVSNTGKIISNYSNKHTPGTTINGHKDFKGYQRVDLWKLGVRYSFKIHRLVASAFISNPECKPEVNHIDGDKQNNSVWNLEWATSKENANHAFKIGLNEGSKGAENPKAKLTESEVILIRKLHAEGVDYKILAKVFPVNNATMHKIVSNQLWKHLKQAS